MADVDEVVAVWENSETNGLKENGFTTMDAA
jgi:hypothetical protein